MARYGVLIFALVVFSSADGWGKDKNNLYTSFGVDSCAKYLGEYANATLSGEGVLVGAFVARSRLCLRQQ